MTASSAPPAEQTRVRPRVSARRGELQRTLVARSLSPVPIGPLRPPAKVSGRAETLAARRLARRQRRTVAALGLLFLAAMLALTVIVLDVFH